MLSDIWLVDPRLIDVGADRCNETDLGYLPGEMLDAGRDAIMNRMIAVWYGARFDKQLNKHILQQTSRSIADNTAHIELIMYPDTMQLQEAETYISPKRAGTK